MASEIVVVVGEVSPGLLHLLFGLCDEGVCASMLSSPVSVTFRLRGLVLRLRPPANFAFACPAVIISVISVSSPSCTTRVRT
jgi:hypothetical protein